MIGLTVKNEDDLNYILMSLDSDHNIPNNDSTLEAVSTVILHAPPDMGGFSLEYIANRVAKMMANKVAYDKLQEIKVKRDTEIQAKQAATQTEGVASGSSEVQKA
jgi:hypothetical protein